MKEQVKIIFYDGECGLCQQSIRWLAGADRQHILRFAPLNGKTYQWYFSLPASMETVVYLRNDQSFFKSSAVVECLRDLPGYGILAFVLRLFPRFLRDYFYDRVAANRHKLTCSYFARDERFLE